MSIWVSKGFKVIWWMFWVTLSSDLKHVVLNGIGENVLVKAFNVSGSMGTKIFMWVDIHSILQQRLLWGTGSMNQEEHIFRGTGSVNQEVHIVFRNRCIWEPHIFLKSHCVYKCCKHTLNKGVLEDSIFSLLFFSSKLKKSGPEI